jgi:hypothetical protein
MSHVDMILFSNLLLSPHGGLLNFRCRPAELLAASSAPDELLHPCGVALALDRDCGERGIDLAKIGRRQIDIRCYEVLF